MACDPQLFSDVDAATFASVKEVLKSEYGLTVDADKGEQSQRGFTFEWEYTADEQSLRIQCVDKPFLIPCSVITSRISDLAARSGITSS